MTHLDSHRVDVNLLVKIVEQGNSLDNHRVDFVSGEFELESTHRVTETERHGVEVFGVDATKKRCELLSNTSVKVLGGRVGDDGD